VWVGKGVDWFYVVDGVSFSAADCAGGVFFEELFAYALVGGGVVGRCGVFGHDGFFLTPLLCCGCFRERLWLGAVIAPHSSTK
jgi:hypothetical protein